MELLLQVGNLLRSEWQAPDLHSSLSSQHSRAACTTDTLQQAAQDSHLLRVITALRCQLTICTGSCLVIFRTFRGRETTPHQLQLFNRLTITVVMLTLCSHLLSELEHEVARGTYERASSCRRQNHRAYVRTAASTGFLLQQHLQPSNR